MIVLSLLGGCFMIAAQLSYERPTVVLLFRGGCFLLAPWLLLLISMVDDGAIELHVAWPCFWLLRLTSLRITRLR